MTDPAFPSSPSVNINTLSRLFNDTTNSYKHLFFNALLKAFQDSAFKHTTFSLRDLAIGLLAEAWHPVRVYKLSLGARDQVAVTVQGINISDDSPIPASQLRARLGAMDVAWKPLMNFVPYRLLAPFFAQELRGVDDHRRNGVIASLADQMFDQVVPLYRLNGKASLEIHSAWAEYIAANFPVVKGWAERRWIGYLQARNPTVPAISEKTSAPLLRSSLAPQKRYWKAVFAGLGEPPRCIYSGALLDTERFDLDHFLPWTFVCHDAIWNLLPVSPEANLAKSNRLPNVSYLKRLAGSQHAGLVAAQRTMSIKEWVVATSSFVSDLRIPEEKLCDAAAISEAYASSVAPQLDIARGIGFEPGWVFGR